jgi:hypothetical protein
MATVMRSCLVLAHEGVGGTQALEIHTEDGLEFLERAALNVDGELPPGVGVHLVSRRAVVELTFEVFEVGVSPLCWSVNA